MQQCTSCTGFLPAQNEDCPNCSLPNKAKFKHRFKRVLQLILGGSITMTLAACYGAPPSIPCDDGSSDSETETPKCGLQSTPSESTDPTPSASPPEDK